MADQDHNAMTCDCVERHVPLPKKTFPVKVGDEIIELCPTSYYNMWELLTAYDVYDGIPPGSVQKHYSKYVRELVFALFKETLVQ